MAEKHTIHTTQGRGVGGWVGQVEAHVSCVRNGVAEKSLGFFDVASTDADAKTAVAMQGQGDMPADVASLASGA
eukprot:3939401-Rhodomonas_salina.3